MPWIHQNYISPSALHLNKTSAFKWRKFSSNITAVISHGRYAGKDLRSWYNWNTIEKRTFKILYGFHPRCHHKGSWGKPGTFRWKIHNNYLEIQRWT